MFGFRLATVFLLGYRLSQQKTTRYSETLAVYSYAPVNAQYAISRDFSWTGFNLAVTGSNWAWPRSKKQSFNQSRWGAESWSTLTWRVEFNSTCWWWVPCISSNINPDWLSLWFSCFFVMYLILVSDVTGMGKTEGEKTLVWKITSFPSISFLCSQKALLRRYRIY